MDSIREAGTSTSAPLAVAGCAVLRRPGMTHEERAKMLRFVWKAMYCALSSILLRNRFHPLNMTASPRLGGEKVLLPLDTN